MKYLTLTNENITSMKKDKFNLIAAPTGNGKTTAVIRDLGGHCEENNKTMLYLVPRKSLEEQLIFDYGSAEHITFKTYQYIGKKLKYNNFSEHYDYIIFDEAHTLITNSTYDFSCYKLVNYINSCTDSIILGMTATPKPLFYLAFTGLLKKEINPLDVETYNNSMLGKIYLVHNKEDFYKAQRKALENNSKVFNLTNDVFSFDEFRNAHKGYKCATILSKSNKYSLLCKGFENDTAYKEIIENKHMNVDALSTTTVLELGVSIRANSNFLVSFDGNFMPHTIEQLKSRIRANPDNNFKLDMLFQIKNNYSPYLKLSSLSDEINECYKMYQEYGCFEEILKHNPADKEEGLGEEYEKNKKNNYERFNPVAYSYLRYQIEFYENQYTFQYSQEIFYIDMLQKMYPSTEIVVLESADLYDLESLLEDFLGFDDEVMLYNSQIKDLKDELSALKLDKKNPNRKIGLKRLNDYLKDKSMPYIVETTRKTINGEKETVWIIKRTAE